MLCRSAERANAAIEKMSSEISTPIDVKYIQFDLTDLKSGQAAANEIIAKESRLDVIVASAGVMAWPYKLINGIEVQFANHTGHFALIQPLLPLLIKTSKEPDSHVRIVNVSSLGELILSLIIFSASVSHLRTDVLDWIPKRWGSNH
jgi:NAD(P)-dependent dehydrogenase (short-subunit alcohol dehydrogenase family)